LWRHKKKWLVKPDFSPREIEGEQVRTQPYSFLLGVYIFIDALKGGFTKNVKEKTGFAFRSFKTE